MVDVVTPNKGLTIPTQGGDIGAWGGIINTDISLIDTSLGGTLFLPITGNTILTSAQTENTGYTFSGTLSGGSTISFPAYSGFAAIRNNTSGGFSLTCGVSGGGTTVVVTSGTTSPIWCDGTNFLQLASNFEGGASTGTGLFVLQTTPIIITPTVSGYITLQDPVSGSTVLTAPSSGGGTITFPQGNKTLADTLLDNVTLTGDVSNSGTTITVSNLSHVTNGSVLPSALASGYVTLGTTQLNIGAALATSGISGLSVINSTIVSGTSGFFSSLSISGAALTVASLTATTISGTTITAPTVSGTSIIGHSLSGTTVTSPAISGTTITGPTISGTSIIGSTVSGTTITGITLSGTNINGVNVTAPTISGTTVTAVSGIFDFISGAAAFVVHSLTGSYQLLTSDSGAVFTNGNVSSGSGVFSLPSSGNAEIGLYYSFSVLTSGSTLVVSGGVGSTLAIGTQTSVSGLISSNSPYSSLTLVCVSGDIWIADRATGQWVVT